MNPQIRRAVGVALLVAAVAVLLLLRSGRLFHRDTLSEPGAPTDLAAYRAKYPTRLTRHGPPPPLWQDPTPLELPPDADEITYDSGPLKLRAWLSRIPADGHLHPAVVFCHGGFWFGNEDWDVLQPFLDAGFIVLAPRVRAENGNPGDFENVFGEVDDAVAAGRYLASLKGIDKNRLFVSGHSAGGELAVMAAMMDSPFVMAAPIGAGLDIRPILQSKEERYRQLTVFDPADIHEVEGRCPLFFTRSLRIPVRLFHGDRDWGESYQKRFVALAGQSGYDASLTIVPGDHGQSLPNALAGIIAAFRSYVPPRSTNETPGKSRN